MFGLLYALVVGIGNTISYGKTKIEDLDGKHRGIQRKRMGQNNENIYFDHRGRMRDINTGELRNVYMKDGDWIVTDNNLNVLRNLTKEKQEREYEKAKSESSNSTRAVYYTYWSFNNTPIKKKATRITGDVYKDIHTDQLYLVRYISWNRDDLSEREEIKSEDGKSWLNSDSAEFYMNPYNAELIDVTDKWKQTHSNYNVDSINRFIMHFNNEQRKGGWKDLAKHYGSVQSLYIHA